MNKKSLCLSFIICFLLLGLYSVNSAVKFTSPTIDKDFPEMVSRIGNWLFTIGLVLTVLMLVIAGYVFATSSGNAQKIQNARRIILFTLIGFLIISLSSGIIALTKLILNLETFQKQNGLWLVFTPPVDNSDVLISIPINKSFDSPKDNIFTWNTQPIFSLAITGKATINSHDGFARVILTDTNNKKYLVYEAIGPFDQGNKTFEYFCHETCTLGGITPKSLDTELKGSSIKIDTIFTLNNFNDFSNPVKTQGIATYTSSLQKQQATSVIDKINSHNKSKGLRWTAGETGISSYTYEQKRALFEVKPSENLPNTQGLEYYKGGIYELTPASSVQMSATSFLPPSFDWRKRHGKNWMTEVKNQGTCGSCWAFASLGAIESVSNLYFNQNLNLDLSEQDLVSCYKGPGAFGCEGLVVDRFAYLYQYLANTGATSENCFKYQASHLNCSNKCSYWQNEVVKVSGGQLISGEENIKNALINQGPIQAAVFVQDPTGTYAHAVVLSGYENDSSGATVWIFKNSWGTSWGEGGYARVRSTGAPELPWYAIKSPISIAKQPNLSINCEDLDGDQYCNWGIRKNKPEQCPSFCNSKPDCDDSNPNLGPFDANYNCTSVQPPPPSLKYTLSVSKSGNGSGTITSNPSGINCGSTCSANFDSGKSITLTAAPSSGSNFVGWSGACSGTSLTCVVIMNSNKSATAEFVSGSTPPPTSCIGSLSCQSSGDNSIVVIRYGFLNCVNKVELYQDNVSKSDLGSGTALGLYVSAGLKPDTSYNFSLKSGGKTIAEKSCSTQPSDPPPSLKYTLSVSKSGNGSGTITSNPSGINCGSTCSANFDSGKSITLTAAPSSGSNFVGWSGACSGTSLTCVVIMNSNKSATAEFKKSESTVVCPELKYPKDRWQRVWYEYNGSQGNCLGETPDEYNIFFDNKWPNALAYGRSNNIMFKSSRTINLPSSGEYTFKIGSDDGVRVWINDALVLDRWMNRSYQIDTFKQNLNAGDHKFRIDYYEDYYDARMDFYYSQTKVDPPSEYTLSVKTAGDGWGYIVFFNKNLSGLHCCCPGGTSGCAGGCIDFNCSDNYPANSSISISATPASHATFVGWSGACSGTNLECVLTMNSNKSATATFSASTPPPSSSWIPCDPTNNWSCGETKTGSSPYCEGTAIGWGSGDDGEVMCPENTIAVSGFCGKKNDDFVKTSESRIKMVASPQTFSSATMFKPRSYWYCNFGCNGWFCGADGCGWASCKSGQVAISRVELKIFDLVGRLIYSNSFNNQSAVTWDGKNAQGQQMANGAYIYTTDAYLADGRKFTTKDTVYIKR